MRPCSVVSLVALIQAGDSLADTVFYNWNVTWVWASPDGFGRPVVGINDQWPCPMVEASVGDTIVISLENQLGNQTTGLHFHGIDQIDTNFMDGAAGTNQCPVPPGHTVTYSFMANRAGTYWYHSHNGIQYPDGLRGPLLIHDPDDPYVGSYDQDVVITVTDWYHEQTATLVSQMLQPSNTQHAPPQADGILVNEGGDGLIPIEAGKTYRMRIINFAALTAAFVDFGPYDMEIIMIDASFVQKQTARQLHIAAAQRYDVLITGNDDTTQNSPILFALDTNPDFTSKTPIQPVAFHWNLTGGLVKDASAGISQRAIAQIFEPYDDAQLKDYGNTPAFGPVTKQWVLNFDYCTDANGYPRACFNSTTFIDQKVPTLYSAASLGDNNTEVEAYGQINAFTVGYGEVLEIVINNHDVAIHPFHLHGHQFQVLQRPFSDAGDWTGATTVPDAPPRRDTITVYANSHAVLRIVADNPGVYLFHCHVEWHVAMGLTATLIEAPEKLVNYQIPQDFVDACDMMDIPTTGNAAGNAQWYDTAGFITVPPTTWIGQVIPEPISYR
ncbi:Cupredoxin [Xylariaceae sp. FL0016]|nr:Cupredoxin [Xylariaceae sp. FL0016]